MDVLCSRRRAWRATGGPAAIGTREADALARIGGPRMPGRDRRPRCCAHDRRDAGVVFLADMLAVRDFGDEPLPFDGPRNVTPYGVNYAVRAVEQRNFPYDPNLGVAPGRRDGGEVTSVVLAILKSGHNGIWLPDAKVQHVIPVTRQTEVYIREYYQSCGKVYAIFDDANVPYLFGVPRWKWRLLWTTYFNYRIKHFSSISSSIPLLKDYALQKGWIEAARKRPRRAASQSAYDREEICLTAGDEAATAAKD
jgi:hypothetical protein